jgi:hypothetical protein
MQSFLNHTLLIESSKVSRNYSGAPRHEWVAVTSLAVDGRKSRVPQWQTFYASRMTMYSVRL